MLILSKFEKCLIIAVFILVIVVMVIVRIYTAGSGTHTEQQSETNTTEEKPKKICLFKECLESSSRIIANMKTSTNPCDDFHNFACGNYIKNPIPKDASKIDTLIDVGRIVGNQLKKLYEDSIDDNEIFPFKYLKTAYKSCVYKSRDNTDIIKQKIKDVGGWSVLENGTWNESSFVWTDLAGQLRKQGFFPNSFFIINAGPMMNDTSKYVLQIKGPLIHYHIYLYAGLLSKTTTAYYKLMVTVLGLMGADKKKAENEMYEAKKFLIDLAKTLTPVKNQPTTTDINLTKIGELHLFFPGVDWVEYINNELLDIAVVDKNTLISIPDIKQFKKVGSLVSQTRKRTLNNVLVWQAFYSYIDSINERIYQENQELYKKIHSISESKPLRDQCVSLITIGMHISAGALYVRKYFPSEAKGEVEVLVTKVKEQFKNILLEANWMDDLSKNASLNKFNKMKTQIGYPNELLDDKKLKHFYQDLEVRYDSFILTFLNITRFLKNTNFKNLNEPSVNRTDWRKVFPAALVNAIYFREKNIMEIPAAILQLTYYGPNRPNYLNYGAIGFIAGHEISHGFDNQGRLFDENGNKIKWWTESTETAFAGMARCIIDQYSLQRYYSINAGVNGKLTENENIADNAGIKAAYLAYKNWTMNHSEEASLPGLTKYNALQMFWISAANIWCMNITPGRLKLQLYTDVHAPDYFRVNIPFGNSGYFAKDFNCSLGSTMNPRSKCKVW